MYVRILWLLWRLPSRNEGPAGGSLEQLKKGGRGKTKGMEEKVLETLKVQTAGRLRILETWRDGGRRNERGAPEIRKKETRLIDHFRF